MAHTALAISTSQSCTVFQQVLITGMQACYFIFGRKSSQSVCVIRNVFLLSQAVSGSVTGVFANHV